MGQRDFRPAKISCGIEISCLVDAATGEWLERESKRTGISVDKLTSAMLRKACLETRNIGAPSGGENGEVLLLGNRRDDDHVR